MCSHGRAQGVPCPWCTGINDLPVCCKDCGKKECECSCHDGKTSHAKMIEGGIMQTISCPKCPIAPDNEKGGWEERFESEFGSMFVLNMDKIKSFISQEIVNAQSEMAKTIIKFGDERYQEGHDLAYKEIGPAYQAGYQEGYEVGLDVAKKVGDKLSDEHLKGENVMHDSYMKGYQDGVRDTVMDILDRGLVIQDWNGKTQEIIYKVTVHSYAKEKGIEL